MHPNYNANTFQSDDQYNDSDYSSSKKKRKQRNKLKNTSPPKQQNKKRKYRDFDTYTNSVQIVSITKTQQSAPPKKRQKINKRSSKKPVISTATTPNSHVTVTFANINGTIDAIILPKQNVLAMTTDVLLENKGKLSIKTSDPIQNDITPQIPIDIKILTTPNIKTIHPRNSFRMGTSLFYCSDEERLFWSFPLRNTRRVSCQHYCCAVEKIVTRSVGIHSNKCNGNHSSSTPCIYAVCNGKPPKGIIPAKLFANYQYFQHSAKTDLLVPKDPNDTKFKKVANTQNNSTMYSNIKIIAAHNPNTGPPPLAPMNDTTNSYQIIKNKYKSPSIKCKSPSLSNVIKQEFKVKDIKNEYDTSSSSKRRRQQIVNGEPAPFVQNVQIDLKALNHKTNKLNPLSSNMTSSSSMGTDGESHDYSALLIHRTSSVLRDIQQNEAVHDMDNDNNNNNNNDIEMDMNMNMNMNINDNKKYIDLLMNGEYDKVISIIQPLIPPQDQPGYPINKKKRNKTKQQQQQQQQQEMNDGLKRINNEYRLLMAAALYYRDNISNGRNDISNALHFCNLITTECDEGDTYYYEAKKIRGLIHKKLRNYKAACHDFEFICYHNPYHKTWRDKLYAINGKSNCLENKIISHKTHQYTASNNNHHHQQQQPATIPIITSTPRHTLHEQGRPNPYYSPKQPRSNEIITYHHHNNINISQNHNYYQPQPPPPIHHQPIPTLPVTNNLFHGLNNPILNDSTFDRDTLNEMASYIMINNALNAGNSGNNQQQQQQQQQQGMNINNMDNADISNPNAPIIYIPPYNDRKNNRNNNNTSTLTNKADKMGLNLQDFHASNPSDPSPSKPPSSGNSTKSVIDRSLLDINYSDLQQPKGFPERSHSNQSFEGLIALAHAASHEYEKKNGENGQDQDNGNQNDNNNHNDDEVMNPADLLKDFGELQAIKRKTTREELLGDNTDNDTLSQYNVIGGGGGGGIGSNQNSSNDGGLSINSNFPNISPLNKNVSKTPEPLDRIRSDCLVRNSSQ